MEDKIDKAIEILAGKIHQAIGPLDAMQLGQAAASFANAKATLIGNGKERKTKGGGSRPATEA